VICSCATMHIRPSSHQQQLCSSDASLHAEQRSCLCHTAAVCTGYLLVTTPHMLTCSCPANKLHCNYTGRTAKLWCPALCCVVLLQARRRSAGTPACSGTLASPAPTTGRAPASAATHAPTHTVRTTVAKL
jgi:hypothetical protein